MPVIYTIFPLVSTSSVNRLTIEYRVVSGNSVVEKHYNEHTLEIVIFQLSNLTFSDVRVYKQLAGGTEDIWFQHISSAGLLSPLEYILRTVANKPSFPLKHLHTEANFKLQTLRTEFTPNNGG